MVLIAQNVATVESVLENLPVSQVASYFVISTAIALLDVVV